MKVHALLALLWLIAFAAMSLIGGPLMLRSGNPSLTLLAFVAPFLWVLASVVLYIAWADSGWREEWERPLPVPPRSQAGFPILLSPPRTYQ